MSAERRYPPAASEAAVDTVIPVDVRVAFEPAPHHRLAAELPFEVQQQRGPAPDLGAVLAEALQLREDARLKPPGLPQAAEPAVPRLVQVGAQLGQVGANHDQRLQARPELADRPPGILPPIHVAQYAA